MIASGEGPPILSSRPPTEKFVFSNEEIVVEARARSPGSKICPCAIPKVEVAPSFRLRRSNDVRYFLRGFFVWEEGGGDPNICAFGC